MLDEGDGLIDRFGVDQGAEGSSEDCVAVAAAEMRTLFRLVHTWNPRGTGSGDRIECLARLHE